MEFMAPHEFYKWLADKKHEKHFYKKSWVHFGFYWSNAYLGSGVSVPDDFGNLVWVGLRNQRLEISEH